jgi:hypothetical protein
MKADDKTKTFSSILTVLFILLALLGVILLIVFSSRSNDKFTTLTDSNELQRGEKISNWFYRDMGHSQLNTKPSYEIDVNFPVVPDKMMIYKIVQPQTLTEDDVREMGQKYFDIPSDANYKRGTAEDILKTKTQVLYVNTITGTLDFSLPRQKGDQYSKNREDYPSDEKCLKIVIDFLKEKGLWEDDAIPPVKDSNDNFIISRYGSIEVWFGSKLGDYRTTGGGRRLMVGIGTDGKVRSVLKIWTKVEPWKLALIKTPQEAFKELKEDKAVFIDSKGGKIDKLSLVYFMPIVEKGNIQPVYYFNVSGPDGIYVLVPAVKSEYIMSDEQMKEIEKTQLAR